MDAGTRSANRQSHCRKRKPLRLLFFAPRIICLNKWRPASVCRGPFFPLYHLPHFLSIEKLHKVLATQIPKLVQNYHLIFKKSFDIIYLQGKGSQRKQQQKSACVRRNINSLHRATSSEELRLVAIEKTLLIPQKK